MLRIPPDACVNEHPLLLSPERRMLQLNLCKSLQNPATRPAICVCRGGGRYWTRHLLRSVSQWDVRWSRRSKCQKRAAFVEMSIVHDHCDTGEAREVCIFDWLIYGSHSSLPPIIWSDIGRDACNSLSVVQWRCLMNSSHAGKRSCFVPCACSSGQWSILPLDWFIKRQILIKTNKTKQIKKKPTLKTLLSSSGVDCSSGLSTSDIHHQNVLGKRIELTSPPPTFSLISFIFFSLLLTSFFSAKAGQNHFLHFTQIYVTKREKVYKLMFHADFN